MPIIANREYQYGILDVTFSMVNESSLAANNQVRLIQAGGAASYPDLRSVSTVNIDSQIYGLDNNYQYQLNQTSLGCGTNEWPIDISISTLYTFSGLFYSIIPPTNDDTLRVSFSPTGALATEFDKQHHGLTSFYQAYLNGADLVDLKDTSYYYSERDIAGLDERLTENIGTYQTNYNLYAQYLAKFRSYWNQKLDSNYQTTIGQVYAELREVGLMGGTDADPYITTGDYFSQSCNKRCTEETLNALLTLKIQGPESDVYSREDCIQHVATIAAKLTEYWNIAYAAATTIGLFLPETWDCVAQLEDSTLPPVYRKQLPLLGVPVSDHWAAGAGPQINQDIVPVIKQQGMRQSRQFKFYNINKMYEQPLALLADTETGNTRYTNTNNYYQPLSVEQAADSRYWVLAQQQHHNGLDTTNAYYAKLSYKEPNCQMTDGERPTPANILRKWISGATIADRQKLNIDWTDIHYNPNISFLTWLAQSREYNDAKYYTLREEHDKLWHHLHEAYPGVFRESNYVNQDASTALELYNASKRELEASCQPQFSYSLTGMDIYMHDSDYNPMRLQVTDQIRIDYQEDIHGADTLGKALREPLYVTGIRHNLRNDGDYQFDVTTRKGTDVMMQRFAQLLNFGN